MVKLYYTSSSSGAACFIAAAVAQLREIRAEQVDMRTHTTYSGKDYFAVNPKGNVPCLVLDDGTVLSETVAVLCYIGSMVRRWI
jgi:glutathione S-transferase